jgi:RNA polymerase-binding protein DksA
MKKTDIDLYKQQLLELRARCTGDVSQLTDEALKSKEASNLSSMPIHMADIGSDNFEQEFTLSLLENEEKVLAEIDGALGRIRAGSFGLCEDCGSAILKERLKAIPYVRHCVECARKHE